MLAVPNTSVLGQMKLEISMKPESMEHLELIDVESSYPSFCFGSHISLVIPVSRNVTSGGGVDSLPDVGEHPGLDSQLNSSSYDGCDNLRKAVRIRRLQTGQWPHLTPEHGSGWH